ncbi:MAG: response regulator [Candidatus Latescibacteria bacterium]|nr:response regulator [Candidatus Latescibacterota bacterium]
MKRQILFVDDEPKVLQGLQRLLRDQTDEWDMTFASSAAEATEQLAQNDYDVALLDVNMPGKNGLELLTGIKADARTRDMEVVMLTGLRDQSLKSQALDLGAADLLNKPVLKEDLVARLNNALRMKSYHEKLHDQNVVLEQQVIRSQKMELVGVLAAGMAHDLNNILALIVGYSEITAFLLPDDSKAREKLKQITRAGDRAGKIVQQILRFGKQTEAPCARCNLGPVIEECLELLRPALPKGVAVKWEGPETDRLVQADATEMYQVLMNLCINAGHAMKHGGVLRISLIETELDADSIPPDHEEIRPGSFLRLEVSDTGDGMDPTTAEHLFEPLFTTKGSQGGTGLGLSVVQRIVKNHGGLVTVESSRGEGTSFFVYLPLP